MIAINFLKIKCKCGGHVGAAEKSKHMDKWKLYCNQCGKFIKFATTEQKAIIKAREAYLKEHYE